MLKMEKPVVEIISALEKVSGQSPCKKTVQKIVYLIEESGDSLGFDYTIHFYGPYSADLDYAIQNLASKGALSIDYTNYGHLISVPDSVQQDATLEEKTYRVIQQFGVRSPSDLELLATTLFVQRKVAKPEFERIVPGVKKIKGSKYTDTQICHAVKELRDHQFF